MRLLGMEHLLDGRSAAEGIAGPEFGAGGAEVCVVLGEEEGEDVEEESGGCVGEGVCALDAGGEDAEGGEEEEGDVGDEVAVVAGEF